MCCTYAERIKTQNPKSNWSWASKLLVFNFNQTNTWNSLKLIPLPVLSKMSDTLSRTRFSFTVSSLTVDSDETNETSSNIANKTRMAWTDAMSLLILSVYISLSLSQNWMFVLSEFNCCLFSLFLKFEWMNEYYIKQHCRLSICTESERSRFVYTIRVLWILSRRGNCFMAEAKFWSPVIFLRPLKHFWSSAMACLYQGVEKSKPI